MLTNFEIETCEKVRDHYRSKNISELQMANLLTIAQYASVYSASKKYLETNQPVLDWSCGSGHFSVFLSTQNAKVTSIGFNSPGYIKQILPSNVTYIEGDFSEPVHLPFKKSEFGVVFSIGVLEHVRETGGSEASSLREMHRILKANGIFFICHLPNKKSWIEYVVRTFFPQKFKHQFLYNKNDIESMAQNSGFKVLNAGRYGIFPKNSLEKLPPALSNSRVFLQIFYLLESLFSRIFGAFCQNWLVILQRQES